MRAVDLFEEGRLNKAEIARELGVCHQTVSDWHELYRKGGRDALRAAGRAGRLPKLDRAQLEAIETELRAGGEGPRLSERPVDAQPGGRGDRGGDRRLLSPQPRLADPARQAPLVLPAPGSPSGRARRRGDRPLGEEHLASDKKSARRRGAVIVFEDESGCSLLPSVRATWAPKGKTPVLRHRFNWKRLSMAGALVYEPDGTRRRPRLRHAPRCLQRRARSSSSSPSSTTCSAAARSPSSGTAFPRTAPGR